MSLENFHIEWTPRLLGVLRIITGFMFMAHGSQKLLNYPASPNGAVPLFSFMGFGGTLELVGGALILVGLFTRDCVHSFGDDGGGVFHGPAPGGFLPLVNKGELAVLYCFVFLFLASAGPGAFSLDGLLRGRSAVRAEAI